MFAWAGLVSPVLSQSSTTQQVFLPVLPAGQHWQNYTNSTEASGWRSVPTPSVDAFPLFYRAIDNTSSTGDVQPAGAYGGFDFRGWHAGHHPNPRPRALQLDNTK